jgi:hypothetical protein
MLLSISRPATIPWRLATIKMHAQSPAPPPEVVVALAVDPRDLLAKGRNTGRNTGDTSKIADGRGREKAGPKLTLAGAAAMDAAKPEGADPPPPPPPPPPPAAA